MHLVGQVRTQKILDGLPCPFHCDAGRPAQIPIDFLPGGYTSGGAQNLMFIQDTFANMDQAMEEYGASVTNLITENTEYN